MLTNDKYFWVIMHKLDNLANIIISDTHLSNIETISSVMVNIVVVLGGVFGLLYYRKLREKQVNAVFSYMTQLLVRIKTLFVLFTTYENQLMERFIPETKRRKDLDSSSSFIDKIVDEFAQYASETLKFLRESNEQMPASQDWSDKYEILVEFLVDVEHLSIKTFYKWISDDDKKQRELYTKRHKDNLNSILHDIQTEQKRNIEKMFH